MVSEERRRRALAVANKQDKFSQFIRSVRPILASLRAMVIAFAIFSVARIFVIEAFKIPSGSMERTLMIGDFLLVNKIGYAADIPFSNAHIPALRHPKLGQVVIFQWPEDRTKNFVKRIVGIPGDTLEMRNSVLFRNSVEQREKYAVHQVGAGDQTIDDFQWQIKYLSAKYRAQVDPYQGRAELYPYYRPSRNNWGPIVVPERNYFVLGDNRDNSMDSRYWGFVPDSLVRGSPLVVYYSYDSTRTEHEEPRVEVGKRGGLFHWLTQIRWQRFGEMIQ